MQVVKPTKNEVFTYLRKTIGCCWLGGSGCQCKSRQLSNCYADAERQLTKTIKTPEEMQQEQKEHEEFIADLNRILDELEGQPMTRTINYYVEQAKALKERAKRENVKLLKGVALRDGWYWAVAYTPAGLVSYRLNSASKEEQAKEIKALNILTV